MPTAASERTGTFFRAVEVRCSGNGCPAAQKLRGKRFLCAEAPSLPLEYCDRQPRCQCYYRHFDDRRRGPRRAQEAGAPLPDKKRAVDERKQPGRRADDFMEEQEDLGATTSVLEDTYYDYVAGKLPE